MQCHPAVGFCNTSVPFFICAPLAARMSWVTSSHVLAPPLELRKGNHLCAPQSNLIVEWTKASSSCSFLLFALDKTENQRGMGIIFPCVLFSCCLCYSASLSVIFLWFSSGKGQKKKWHLNRTISTAMVWIIEKSHSLAKMWSKTNLKH